ncbi:MAG: hypothetical protein HN576_13775 [Bacteriovoracaceae bacterium]|jgi:hypothetical protein|nr:hypothetical protein [Bacteriovoracaceae bacterium]
MLKCLSLFILIFISGCMQTFNSNTGDEGLVGNCVDSSLINLRAAYSVLRTECMSCHTGYHNSWVNNCTDQEWIDTGQVISGDITNSNLLIRMKNFSPPGDMPLSSPQVSSNDYSTLQTWISGM